MSENLEEEESNDVPIIPQIKSNLKLPFQIEMDKFKTKIDKRGRSKSRDKDKKDNGILPSWISFLYM